MARLPDVSACSTLLVEEVTCEYATNPLGVDTVSPRFSWVLASSCQGQRQTAYQVLVAGDGETHDGLRVVAAEFNARVIENVVPRIEGLVNPTVG